MKYKPVHRGPWDSTEAWLEWRPTDNDPWDLAKVVRLHRRAGLGVNWDAVRRDLAEGHEAAIQRILHGSPTGPDGRTSQAIDAFCDVMFESYVANGGHLDSIRHAWFYRLVFTAWPLRERMALAWHAHFATSESKVAQTRALVAQHVTQRQLWRSNVGELHLAMLRDEAMLRWLDGTDNHLEAPNENLAREYFELFSLGVGNYGEEDVRNAARAFTGWHRVHDLPFQGVRFEKSRHDFGEKTILGRTGSWGDEDVVRIANAEPASARRIAWRLWRTFISDIDEPTPELLEGLASSMRVGGDVDVSRGLEVLLRCRLFHDEAYAGRRVSSPVEWLVGILRSGETFPPTPGVTEIAGAAERMGQRLFRPPNVAGWPGGLEWLTGSSLVARQNFAVWLTGKESGIAPGHWRHLAERHRVLGDPDEIEFWCHLFWGRGPDPRERDDLVSFLAADIAESRETVVRALLLHPAAHLV